ncbi:MAG: PAS domain-containing protein [Sulfuricurvum sp.]|uniref:PAS domain-containing protein n=1 Tax=Sulfuricurvum sp. TaxID=2025608 RepID=UPI0026066C6A|nr:PAS domain-containing protein [Sulfuricurvum sp.]MDD2828282.1 PAS domain-containing protein [Sulfuricurvum sp.]MDD4949763.1 PAS domain-containing protein [Sulfuricurvum sp.]
MERPTALDEEYFFEGRAIVSETDLDGVITFANRRFCEISGYSASELVGQPHNIIRHPDMPKAAFAQVWKTIQSGTIWHGLVKNLRKDGKYYWVDTEVSPIYDNDGVVKGYMAARKPASRKNIEETAQIYKQMLEQES